MYISNMSSGHKYQFIICFLWVHHSLYPRITNAYYVTKCFIYYLSICIRHNMNRFYCLKYYRDTFTNVIIKYVLRTQNTFNTYVQETQMHSMLHRALFIIYI